MGKIPTSMSLSNNFAVVCDEAYSIQSMQAARTEDTLKIINSMRFHGSRSVDGSSHEERKGSTCTTSLWETNGTTRHTFALDGITDGPVPITVIWITVSGLPLEFLDSHFWVFTMAEIDPKITFEETPTRANCEDISDAVHQDLSDCSNSIPIERLDVSLLAFLLRWRHSVQN